MGNVISSKASIDDQLRDMRLTLQRAPHVSADWAADAERFLGEVHAAANAIEEELAAARTQLDELRAQRSAGDHRCNDLVGRIKDEVFNDVGRTRRHPQFQRVFPSGIRTYTEVAPRNKPLALRRLTRMLQTHRPPQLAEDQIRDAVDRLLNAADDLAAINEQLAPHQDEVKLIEAQRTATARQAQLQLARLKTFWLSLGVPDVDIHRMIPDRPTRGGRSAAAVGALATPEDAAEPTAAVPFVFAPLEASAAPPLEAEDPDDVAAK